ncbi:TadE family type IV pilus minor pilin [Amycolatopsis sp. CA-128772]|uniref:TadE family type IV pilus minor pilin n=1 Tax=Amycolatopsis sp. CA-128772 TaxID=2073159 RepID=UPI000CD19B29|nr:TadE family type IV pilus minor pilin [Amycolatopsis sp. CA-128772]
MTVEAALGMAGMTVMTVLLLASLVAMVGQLRCTDAAGEAARLLARGRPQEAAAAVDQIAPSGANLTYEQVGDRFTVRVTALPAGDLLPAVHLKATAYAVAEPKTEVANAPG